jgi:hypothetical protein
LAYLTFAQFESKSFSGMDKVGLFHVSAAHGSFKPIGKRLLRHIVSLSSNLL